jgi:UDP-N-acetylmuramoyl-tripeptide--D-alanyl-D-alanine ligase
MSALWSSFDIADAVDGEVEGAFSATGVAFDSREVGAGDLFIALRGEATDGHRFVDRAFAAGAAGAIVSAPIDQPHVRVADTTAALEALGRAARARTAAKIVGVTGSVGKTGTKEALFEAIDRAAPGAVHRSVKSYNNHTGVPLSLARMPATSRFGIFEMGMNHAGEIAALTRMVRPHVAVITAIAPAHIAQLGSLEAIADAKAEIFAGLEPGGAAIIPHDSPYRDRLVRAAERHAARIVTFGRAPGADVIARDVTVASDGRTIITAALATAELTFTLGMAGDHWVSNAMAVLAVVEALGGDLAAAGLALADMRGLAGRGARIMVPVADGVATLIDESYNANPASMAATLAQLGRERAGRRIAVLGAMRELGPRSPSYHADLAAPIQAAGVDHALLVGAEMAPLANMLEGRVDFAHVADAAAALDHLAGLIAPGDAVLVKGSNAIGLATVVARLAGGMLASEGTPCSI